MILWKKSICSDDRRRSHQVIFLSSRFHPTEKKKSPFSHSCKPSVFRRMRPRALSSVPLPHKRQTENQTNNKNNKTTAVADGADQHHTYLSSIHQNSRTGRNPYHHHHYLGKREIVSNSSVIKRSKEDFVFNFLHKSDYYFPFDLFLLDFLFSPFLF